MIIISILAYLVAALTILPLLSFVLMYILLFLFTRNKKASLQWSITALVFLLFLSVVLTFKQIWNVSLLWVLILLIVVLALGLAYLQFRKHNQIDYRRLIKGVIRLSFVILLPMHLLLYLWVFLSSLVISIIN